MSTINEVMKILDGRPLDYTTGSLTTDLWAFSAPSKESVHLGFLAYVLAEDKRYQRKYVCTEL